jgi:hypothetical protein
VCLFTICLLFSYLVVLMAAAVIGAAVILLRLTLVEAEARACPRPEDAARTRSRPVSTSSHGCLTAECLRLQGTASDNVAHHRPDTGTRRLQDSDGVRALACQYF